MRLLGPSLEVAELLGLLQGVAATLLIYAAARAIGQPRSTAFLAAAVATLFSHSALLGALSVPEALTAALIVFAGCLFGSAGLGAEHGSRLRLLVAGFALLVASASRYEAWPVAGLFSASSFFIALERRSRTAGLACALALLGPCVWMLHGVLRHGDPLFFAERVTAYGRALAPPAPFLERLLLFPIAVVREEPELLALVVGGVVASRGIDVLRRAVARLRMLLAALLLLLGFLVAGALLGGSPTHHPERALLAVWFGICLLLAETWTEALKKQGPRTLVTGALSLALAIGLLAFRESPLSGDAVFDRRNEIAIGRAAAKTVPAGAHLLIDTPDFGYFAVIAAFERPLNAEPFDDHDPRTPRRPAFDSPEALTAFLRARAVPPKPTSPSPSAPPHQAPRWFVATEAHAVVAAQAGELRARVPGFGLYEIL